VAPQDSNIRIMAFLLQPIQPCVRLLLWLVPRTQLSTVHLDAGTSTCGGLISMLKRTFPARGMPWRSRFRFPNNTVTARPTPFFLRARQKKPLFSSWRREGCKPLTGSVVDYFGVINSAATRLEPDRQSGASADHAVSDFFSVHGFAPGRPPPLATA